MKIDITIEDAYGRYLRSDGTWGLQNFMDGLELAGYRIVGRAKLNSAKKYIAKEYIAKELRL